MILFVMACNLGKSAPNASVIEETETARNESRGEAQSASVEEESASESNSEVEKPASVCDNPYWPIVVGAEWIYKTTTQGDVTSFTRTIEKIEGEDNAFLDKDVYDFGVTRYGRWLCEEGNLVMLDPNGSAASVTAGGLDVEMQASSAEGFTIPASLNDGDTWKQTIALEGVVNSNNAKYPAKEEGVRERAYIGKETVSVEAGTFNAIRIDCQTTISVVISFEGMDMPPTTINITNKEWYAEGVGAVKIVATWDGFDSTSELVSYSIP
ncbi:MAG: hypothetical protein LC099_00735 [Anaerolineales bacterium]|nr:hypothetical protein [Anaerolineales bacterium]